MRFLTFAQAVTKYVVNPNEKWLKWGSDNSTPEQILGLYQSVPEHTSAIDFIEANIIGIGINYEKLNYWDTKKIVLDYLLFGGFTLQIIKQRGGDYTLSYVDISKCRLSADEKSIAYSEEWDKFRPEITWIPITNSVTTEGIYFFKSNKSRDKYPSPYYLSATQSLDTMKSIIDYHNNNAKNGFAPNVVINMNNGIPDDDTQAAIEKGIKQKFAGEKGQKFILSFNESESTKTTIEKLDNDNLDQKFETLQKFIQNQIIISHKITSGQLIGVKPENTGFSKQEYDEALEVFKDITINSFRNELAYALTTLTGVDIVFKDKVIEVVDQSSVSQINDGGIV